MNLLRIVAWWFLLFALALLVVLAAFAGIQEIASEVLPGTDPTVVAVVGAPTLLAILGSAASISGYSIRDILPPKVSKELRRERARLLRSKDVPMLYKKANEAYFQDKDYPWTIDLANAILKLWPQHGDALDLLYSAHLRDKSPESAADAASKLIQLEPLNWRGYYGLGQAYIDMYRWAEAVSALKEALARKPEKEYLSHVLFDLARAYEHNGTLDAAIETYLEYLKAVKDDPHAVFTGVAAQSLHRLIEIREERQEQQT